MSKLIKVFLVVFLLSPFSIVAKESDKNNTIKLNDHNVTISEVLTFEELVADYAKNEGVSYDEAKAIFYKGSIEQDVSLSSLAADTYRTISADLNVTTIYIPTINFYCKTNEDRYHGFIEEILNVNLNRSYDRFTYQYVGSIYYNLESPNTIYYTMDGDFYKNATVSISGGGSIGLGESASITFGGSYTSNHYQYFYVDDRINWGTY